MPKSLTSLISLNAGEWSPQLDSRADLKNYRSANRELQNMICMKQGGVTRRPGTRFIADGKFNPPSFLLDNFAIKLQAWKLSPTTQFMLEFGDKYIRFYSNKQQVVVASAPAWVSGKLYFPGDYVTSVAIIYYCTASNSLTTAPLANPLFWRAQTILEVPTPYGAQIPPGGKPADTDIFQIQCCQINDVMKLTHPSYPPYILTRFSDTVWTMKVDVFDVPALLDANATRTTLAASALKGSVTVVASAPAWATSTYYQRGDTVLQGGVIYKCLIQHTSGTFATDLAAYDWEVVTVFQSGHVGSQWQISHINPASFVEYELSADGVSPTLQLSGVWNFTTYGTWSADIILERSLDNGITWETIRSFTSRLDANFNEAPSIPTTIQGLYRFTVSNWAAMSGTPNPRAVLRSPSSFVRGLVTITAYTNAYSVTATVLDKIYATTATEYWAEGAWSAVRGYPAAVWAFQQRFVYGGTAFEPQKFWGSVTDDFNNFDYGDSDLATNAIAYGIAATAAGPIRAIVGQSDLFIFMSGKEYVANSGQGGAITPTDINTSEISAYGSALGVSAIIAGDAAFYVQRQGKTIRQLLFSIATNKYMSQELTVWSDHLFEGGIVQMAYQQNFKSEGIVWAVTLNGLLCGMTYELQQEVFGWSRHTTSPETADTFESVAVLDGLDTDNDQVWVVCNRQREGHRYRSIELIDNTNWEDQHGAVDPTKAYFVDCGYQRTNVSSATISGLTALEGREVTVTVNGMWAGLFTVASGAITLPAAPTAATVNIGLPITYKVQPMRLDVDPRYGFTQSLEKAVSDVYVRVYQTATCGVVVGTRETDAIFRRVTNTLGVAPPLFTGETRVQVSAGYDTDPEFSIQGSIPLPLTVLALVVHMNTTGRP